MYNYLEAITDDVKEYIKEHKDELINFSSIEDCEEYLSDVLWLDDSVTGNASGSYTFSTWQAEENLCHNLDLLQEACEEFFEDIGKAIKQGAEYCDVTIRCYLLGEAIGEALEEFEDEFEKAHEDTDEEEK